MCMEVMASRMRRLVRGVVWFVADPLVYRAIWACSTWTRTCAREFAPAKKREFSRPVLFAGLTYHVLPDGWVHGGRAGKEKLRFTPRLAVLSTVVLATDPIVTLTRVNGSACVLCPMCKLCNRYHEFIAMFRKQRCYSLRKYCYDGVYTRIAWSGDYVRTLSKRERVMYAVVAFAKSMKQQ